MNGEDEAAPAANLVDLIEALQPPPEPSPVSMMPQTWGWAVLAVLVSILILRLAWRAWRRWRANAYRRAALAELDRAGDDPAAIAGILRRCALATWPRGDVASLTGTDWLAFLERTGRGSFSEAGAKALLAGPYRPSPAATPGLRREASAWVRQHKVEGKR
jgi:hypothetical protein